MGIHLNNTELYTLWYADNQIVITEEYDDIQCMTQKIVQEYKKMGFRG